MISQIEFRPVDDESSWAAALDGAADPGRVRVTVIDRNSHQPFDLLAAPLPSPD